MIRTIWIIWADGHPAAAYISESTALKELKKRQEAAGEIIKFNIEPAPLLEEEEDENN